MKKLDHYTREELLRFCQEKEEAYKADLKERVRLEEELRQAHAVNCTGAAAVIVSMLY